MTVPLSVLIVSGSVYFETLKEIGLKSHAKLISILEFELNVKFQSKYFIHSSGVYDTNDESQQDSLLSTLCDPHGAQYCLELIDQSVISRCTKKCKNCFCVADGIQACIATKIIECAHGLNSHQRAHNIVLLTNCFGLQSSIESAVKIGASVVIVPTSSSHCPHQLKQFLRANTEDIVATSSTKVCSENVFSETELGANGINKRIATATGKRKLSSLCTNDVHSSNIANELQTSGRSVVSNDTFSTPSSAEKQSHDKVSMENRILKYTAQYLCIQRAIQGYHNVIDQSGAAINQLGLADIMLHVQGATSEGVNGKYHCVGVMNRGGMFEKVEHVYQGGNTYSTLRCMIYKCLIYDKKCFVWFLSEITGKMHPGHSQDINHYYCIPNRPTDKVPAERWYSMRYSEDGVHDMVPTVTGIRQDRRRIQPAHSSGGQLNSITSSLKKHDLALSKVGVSSEPVLVDDTMLLAVYNDGFAVQITAESELTNLLSEMFPTAPTDKIYNDIVQLLHTLSVCTQSSKEQTEEVVWTVCNSFKEMFCLNNIYAKRRDVSLVFIEFVDSSDSAHSALCKVLHRVYPALIASDFEKSIKSTVNKLSKLNKSCEVLRNINNCYAVIIMVCEVLARCADIIDPFVSLNVSLVAPSPALTSAVSNNTIGNDNCEKSGNMSPPAVVIVADTVQQAADKSTTDTVVRKRDQLLEKLFVALFRTLFPSLAQTSITCGQFASIFTKVSSEGKLTETQTKTVCRAVYKMLNELKIQDDQVRNTERIQCDIQVVLSGHSEYMRCVLQLRNVFRYLTEHEVVSLLQQAIVEIGNEVKMNMSDVGLPSQYAISVLTKFCKLLSNMCKVSASVTVIV